MAMMKFEILKKFSDPTEARDFYDTVAARPLAVVVKRVGEKVTDYVVCKPFIGDAYDRVADQVFSLDITLRENVVDQDAAEAVRVGVVDGLILEFTNPAGDVDVYADDGSAGFIKDMLNDPGDPTLTADGKSTSAGAHRAREGWAPSELKPTGQAFEDYKRGGHSEGNTLN